MVIDSPYYSVYEELASPEQTATGKDVSNPLYGCDGCLLSPKFQLCCYKDWKLLFFDVAASFDSVVHRVHAVSFDAAVASTVSAAYIIAASSLVSAGICDAADPNKWYQSLERASDKEESLVTTTMYPVIHRGQDELGSSYGGKEESSPIYLPYEESALGYLKFSFKNTKRVRFGMAILDKLISENIRSAIYYPEYVAKVAKYQRYLAGEVVSDDEAPATKPAKGAKPKTIRKPKPQSPKTTPMAKPAASKISKSTSSQPPKPVPAKPQEKKRKLVLDAAEAPSQAKCSKAGNVSKKRKLQSTLQLVDEFVDEGVPTDEPRFGDKEADMRKAVEESLKDAFVAPRGPLPPVVIREPEPGKYEPLPEVQGKGKEKVGEEQAAQVLLNLHTPKKKDSAEQFIFQRRTLAPTVPSSHEEPSSLYVELGLTDSEMESDNVASREGQAGLDPGKQVEDQAGSDLGKQVECQAGSDPGVAADSQIQPSHVVHAGPNLEHMNLEENLKLPTEGEVRLEEPASSDGTLSSMQNLDKELSFTNQFLAEKSQEDEPEKTNTEVEVQSMVTVPIHQDTSSVPLMTSPIIDLTVSQPASTTVQALIPTSTATRIGELERCIVDLVEENQTLEERLDKQGNRMHQLETQDLSGMIKEQIMEYMRTQETDQKINEMVKKAVTASVQYAMRAPLRARFKDLPTSDMKEILLQRMLEENYDMGHEDHKMAYEALQKSILRDESEQFDAEKAEKLKKIKRNTTGVSDSTQDPLPPPSSPTTNQDAFMHEESDVEAQDLMFDDEDIGSRHIPKVNLNQEWFKPISAKERPMTPEPAWNVCKNNSVRVKKCFVCGSKLHLIKDCDFYNCVESVPCKSKAASVPAGSRNSPASDNAGGSNPAASRNRPAVNSAGRPNPAGWSKRPAPVSAGRQVSAGWLNPAARPYFRPSSVHFNNMYWPNVYDPMYMNKGRWGTAVKTSAGYSWRNKRPQFWGSKSNGGSHQSTWFTRNDPQADQVRNWLGSSMVAQEFDRKQEKADDFCAGQGRQCQNLEVEWRISGKEDFQLPNESQVVLRIPRKCDLYTFSISELQSEQNVTCLVAKASLDESTRWHRRMAHVNFKTINKLAKEGLVDGLPLKVFTNEHNCVAYNKGKQHKASYKHIFAVRLITEPLQMLHMDLFGPTTIQDVLTQNGLLHWSVTDDFSRKPAKIYKVKGIRCDNGTESKMQKLIELRREKGIKRDYSNPRTPQQNGIAERKNRTLIEAAKTMLADSKLPTMFWTEAVSTPAMFSIGHLKPFGCQVTILNTSDHLGKFEGKADEGYLVGYAPNSKAYRVYNLTNKRVEETMNLRFLEDKPNVQGIGHEWYFDLDYLTDSLGYTRFKTDKPAGTQETNINAGTQDHESDSEVDEQVIVVPSFPSNSFAGPSSSNGPSVMERNADYAEELAKLQRQEYEAKDAAARYGYLFSQATAEILSQAEAEIRNQGVSADRDPAGGVSAGSASAGSDPAGGNPAGSFQPAGSYEPAGQGNSAVSTSVSADFIPVHAAESTLPPGQSLGSSENTTRFPLPSDTVVDVNPVPTRRVNTIHPQSQILGDLASPVLTRSRAQKSKFGESAFIGYIQEKQRQIVYVTQPKGFEDPYFPKHVYRVVKALYGLHQAPRAWYARLSAFLLQHNYRRGTIDKTLFIKKDSRDILLVYVYVDDILFGSTNKAWCEEFEVLMKGEFEMSAMGEMSFFLGLQVKQLPDGIFISQDKYVKDMLTKFDMESVRTATTPYEAAKTKLKDETDPPVNVHLYRSMIGSLMYLTASRPDIMFAVSACSRHQVTPLTSHLNAVKKIFKYLKGQPKLGLWYPKDSPFQLEAYSDSDYAGSHGDRKSTTGGCQFLGRRLISWQCKKQTIVATSSTEAEYVAAASCCAQVVNTAASCTLFLLTAMDYADGSVFMLVGILLLVDSFLLIGFVYADNTSIYIAELVVLFDIAGWLVSATSHFVSAGSLQSCWCTNVSAE
ncbi:putative ribonuclease H-like domain-containing protein [Tanacetum coccineum]